MLKNTRIAYQYRDSSNNKAIHQVTFAGLADEPECRRIMAAMRESLGTEELGDFIPGQVGLKDLQNAFYERHIEMAEALAEVDDDASEPERDHAARFAAVARDMKSVKPIWWPDDDAWHALLMIDGTTAEPTDPRTIREFLEEVEATVWDETYRPPFHSEMVANYEAHLREQDDDEPDAG